jgi:hypothetical protein
MACADGFYASLAGGELMQNQASLWYKVSQKPVLFVISRCQKLLLKYSGLPSSLS